MHAYCLFCETQKCAVLASLLSQKYGARCLSPQIIQRKWSKGICEEKRHDWLPGYLFLYSENEIRSMDRIPGVLRWLGNGELTEEDRAFADMLLLKYGVMGTIRLAEVGDRCTINDPHWEGMSGTIEKIDRGRKRCCVSFVFDRTKRSVWLGYDLVVPAKSEDE